MEATQGVASEIWLVRVISSADRLAQWRDRFACLWASEHLSYSRSGSGHESNAAMALPSPYDRELLELLIDPLRPE